MILAVSVWRRKNHPNISYATALTFLAEPRQLAQVPLDGISRLILLIRLRLTEEGLEKI